MIPRGTIGKSDDNAPLSHDDAVETVCASVGQEHFLDAAMALICTRIANEMRWIITYSRTGRPIVHHHSVATEAQHRIDIDRVRTTYEGGFFRFDPFYRHWRETGAPGVIRMGDVIGSGDDADVYLSEFIPITGIEDDLAILLQISEYEALGLCIERQQPFLRSEAQCLEELYPMLGGLAKSHFRLVPTQGANAAKNEYAPLNFKEALSRFLPNELTARERQIIGLALVGLDNATIAKRLGVSIGTIKNHRKRIYVKIDITSERELFSLFLGFLAEIDPSELARTTEFL